MRDAIYAVALYLLMVVPAVGAADMTDLLKALPAIPSGGSAQGSGTVASDLKEALSVGTKNAVGLLSKKDGYFRDGAVKILLPDNVRRAGDALRMAG